MRDEKRYFLKNSALFEEMQKSKLTYCCYDKENYDGHYDIIVEGYSLITPNILKTYFNKKNSGDSVIIRVITDEHIGEEYKKYDSKGKLNLQYLKMFPFKHFIFNKEDVVKCLEDNTSNEEIIKEKTLKIDSIKNEIKENEKIIRLNKLNKIKQEPYKDKNKLLKEEVLSIKDEIKELSKQFSENIMKYGKEILRSHWSGDTIETGHFDVSQGNLSEGLVVMIMMLVSKYARSGNWASYTFRDDMESAAMLQLYDTALKFEEVKGNNVFAYLTQIASNRFTYILNTEKNQRKIKSKLMQQAGYNATYNEQVDFEMKLRAEELGLNDDEELSLDYDDSNQD
jgi:hypothetical protein